MLTDSTLRALKPKSKQYKRSDAHGLYVLVKPTGSILWRYKYRFAGREKALALGKYPQKSLKEARLDRNKAAKLLEQGTDPSIEKRRVKAEVVNTFEVLSAEWMSKKGAKWSERYKNKTRQSLELDVYPDIGSQPVANIGVLDVKRILDRVQRRGALEVASRLRQRIEAIFTYAIGTGRATENPAMILKGTLEEWKPKNRAHITRGDIPEFMATLKAVQVHPINKIATEILLRCFVRTSEMRFATWKEIKFRKKVWEISGERMKNGRDFIVPLSPEVVKLFKEAKKINGSREYVFASPVKPRQPISENAVLNTLYKMGYKGRATGHGFRHLASTCLNEMGFNPDAIERQLDHVDGSVRGVYNKAEYLDERRELMNQWSTEIDR